MTYAAPLVETDGVDEGMTWNARTDNTNASIGHLPPVGIQWGPAEAVSRGRKIMHLRLRRGRRLELDGGSGRTGRRDRSERDSLSFAEYPDVCKSLADQHFGKTVIQTDD